MRPQGEETAELLAKATSFCYTPAGALVRPRVAATWEHTSAEGGAREGVKSPQKGGSSEERGGGQGVGGGGDTGGESGGSDSVGGGDWRAEGEGEGGRGGRGEGFQGPLRCASVEYVHLETPQIRVS